MIVKTDCETDGSFCSTSLNIVTVMCHVIWLSRYCGTRNISQSVKGKLARKKGLNVSFTSNKKKSGGGAQCTAECIDPAPTTSTTTATTTTNNLLCGHDVGSLPSSSMRHIKSQGSTYFIVIFFSIRIFCLFQPWLVLQKTQVALQLMGTAMSSPPPPQQRTFRSVGVSREKSKACKNQMILFCSIVWPT